MVAKFKGFNKNAILLMLKQGIPVYGHYKMFKNRNYNNASQKRLAKFALIKYRINFLNYGITAVCVCDRGVCDRSVDTTSLLDTMYVQCMKCCTAV